MRDRPRRAARNALLSIGALQLAAIVFGPGLASAVHGAWLELVPVLAPLCRSGGTGSFAPGFTDVAPLAGAFGAAALHGLHALALLAAGGGAAALLARFTDRRTQGAARP